MFSSFNKKSKVIGKMRDIKLGAVASILYNYNFNHNKLDKKLSWYKCDEVNVIHCGNKINSRYLGINFIFSGKSEE